MVCVHETLHQHLWRFSRHRLTAKRVYSEIDLKINVLNIELRKATNPLQKSLIKLDLTALGRDKVIVSNEYDIFNIPVILRHSGTGGGEGRGHRLISTEKRGKAIF